MAKASGWGSEDRGFKSRRPDMSRVLNFIYKNEGKIGIIGFIFTFITTYFLIKRINIFFIITIGIINWLSAFFIGDSLNRFFKEGSIFPHKKNQENKIRNLVLASFFMNLFSDVSGSFFGRLWYYPVFNINFIFYVLLAPIGYVFFGYILYVFYRLVKKKLDDNVRPGRMSKFGLNIYKIIINTEMLLGVFGVIAGFYYYYNFYQKFNVKWYQVNQDINQSINLGMVIFFWLSIFFILEFICYKLSRETLTRDLIRGDYIPLISIIFSSVICIILVEFVNSPFQLWTFTHWPINNIRLMNIPIVAYMVWPMQYLILLPLIRIFDGNNVENVW